MAPVHAYSSSVTRATCLEQADRVPAWDACDELEPEDVATADGVNMILYTLAEAFQDDYDVDGPHTAHVSQAKEALIEHEEDIELEIALAALEQEGDIDLEETDVEMPLACKESRPLRGEQREKCDRELWLCAAKISFASPALLCRTPAMESSALVLRTRYRTAVRAVRVRERLRSIASGE